MVLPSALVRTLIVACLAAVLAFAPAQAQQVVITTTVTWTYTTSDDDGDVLDEDAALLDDEAVASDADLGATRRYAPSSQLAALGRAKAVYGPFSVIDATTVRMAGDVDGATPRQFAAMLAAYPTLKRIEMVDCPGSLDEAANLILARAIRRQGMETVVPAGGSVRSGAVELWMAGVRRSAAPDAEFGVHSWADEYGREARDYPASDPVHAEYLSYYREMGLDDAKAHAFYAMTNATPFDDVTYLTRDDMARYVTLN
ncbi:alpha/beta hydrolase [Sphingopyxis sp. OPL5]|uniref:alpha/beta hydrolase n=1 Tax=Sphingopyxis sp. OPL5 TaxID=2486273 RepID=UPI00164E09C8|nr:alpha/beta hydrolase [Sphingopyxis sp. OPL5]QNO29066.1 alpha/beta hydrolase [Sphingopyxis sp. OPL5]